MWSTKVSRTNEECTAAELCKWESPGVPQLSLQKSFEPDRLITNIHRSHSWAGVRNNYYTSLHAYELCLFTAMFWENTPTYKGLWTAWNVWNALRCIGIYYSAWLQGHVLHPSNVSAIQSSAILVNSHTRHCKYTVRPVDTAKGRMFGVLRSYWYRWA